MIRSFALACAALAMMVVPTHAQNVENGAAVQSRQPAATGQYAQQQPSGQSAASGDLNQAIAGCLLLGNQEEIAIAEFAESRAQDPQVKQFAQLMVDDHEKAVAKLTQVAPQLAQQAAAIRGQSASAANGAGQQQTTSAGQGAANPMFALQQRATQECLALTQKELGQKQGAEFDQCYVGSQVGAHIGMLAKLRASQQFATGELKQIIQEAEPTVQKHLDHAKKLAEQVKNANTPRQASQQPAAAQAPRR
jgi:putative membrane protein